jgi:hypothetical protein
MDHFFLSDFNNSDFDFGSYNDELICRESFWLMRI